MNNALPPSLRLLFEAVLGVPAADINAATSPDTVEAWDSTLHVHLILALESEFRISIPPEDAAALLSVGEVHAYLERRGTLAGDASR